MTNNLTMRWIPVADATGRTHMEAVWVSLDDAADRPVPAHQESAASHAA